MQTFCIYTDFLFYTWRDHHHAYLIFWWLHPKSAFKFCLQIYLLAIAISLSINKLKNCELHVSYSFEWCLFNDSKNTVVVQKPSGYHIFKSDKNLIVYMYMHLPVWQSFSSDPSWQSLSKSQRQTLEMHCPLAHCHWVPFSHFLSDKTK